MSIELGAIPLAFVAGALSVLSPCVWPLVPIVMGSAASAGRAGPWALALGLGVAFALAGTVLSFTLLSLGLDPELFRYVAAALLLLIAAALLVPAAAAWLNLRLSRLVGALDPTGHGTGLAAQFAVGMLLGLVWLPCVGPTLGAAIALASLGQEWLRAFVVMFAFGIGTATVLLAAGSVSAQALKRWRPQLLSGAGQGRRWLGWTLAALGVLVLTGLDKRLEAWAVGWLPDWAVSL